jgi:GxxExxY protein
MDENQTGKIIVDSAVALHRELGPGLLESVYEVVLAHKLKQQGLSVKRQVSIPIKYQDIKFEEGFRIDILVENKVIIELKSVECVTRAHKKQVLTYLRLSCLKLGYLLNFGEALMKDVISRIINGEITYIFEFFVSLCANCYFEQKQSENYL